MTMKAADVRALTLDQLDDEVLKLKKEQFNLRFQRATGQLENTSRVRVIRRDIARMKTIAAQKRARMPEPAAKAAPAPKAEKTEKKTKSAKPKAAAKPKSRAKTKSKEEGVRDAEASAPGRCCQRQAGQNHCRARRSAFHAPDDEEDDPPLEEVPRARRSQHVLGWRSGVDRGASADFQAQALGRGPGREEAESSVNVMSDKIVRAAS